MQLDTGWVVNGELARVAGVEGDLLYLGEVLLDRYEALLSFQESSVLDVVKYYSWVRNTAYYRQILRIQGHLYLQHFQRTNISHLK